jgi:amino acid permease
MKQIIGLVLFIVWGLSIILLFGEPTSSNVPDNPEWVGWAYIILVLGTPFAVVNLMGSKK